MIIVHNYSDLLVPIAEAFCPNIGDSVLGGICIQSCSSNSNCTGEQICCPNSCGTICRNPVYVPYLRVPPRCPETELRDLFSICRIDEQSCSMDSDCQENQLCCRDRCGRRCMESVQSITPCFAVLETLLHTSSLFTPSCTPEGFFNIIQCKFFDNDRIMMCWCVNIDTGRPRTSLFSENLVRDSPDQAQLCQGKRTWLAIKC